MMAYPHCRTNYAAIENTWPIYVLTGKILSPWCPSSTEPPGMVAPQSILKFQGFMCNTSLSAVHDFNITVHLHIPFSEVISLRSWIFGSYSDKKNIVQKLGWNRK